MSVIKTKITNIYCENKINDGFILVNPDEIYDFLSDDVSFIELINVSLYKIRNYFPHSIIYLEFVEDVENEDGNSIFANIYNPCDDFKRNYETFRQMYIEFFEDWDSYNHPEYYLDIIFGDEYYRELLENG